MLKSTLNAKSTGFGFGPRSPIVKGNPWDKLPDPATYQLPSPFDNKKSTRYQNQGKSFGASRAAYDRVYSKEHKMQDLSIPGPGHYNQLSGTVATNRNLSFTMLPKLPKESSI